jgi:septal ring factor EnvC (AmiA/AmiB activator)
MNRGKKILVFLLCSIVAFGPLAEGNSLTAYAEKGNDQSDMNSANTKKDALEQEKKKTQDLLDSLKGMKSDTASYVKKLDENLDRINGELNTLNGQIKGKEDDIKKTGQELNDAEKVSEEQYAAMKLRIKYMYEKGNTGYLDLLFSSADLTQLMNRAEYVRKISEYDRKQLDLYDKTCTEITEKQAKLKQDHEELLALKDETTAKQESAKTLLANKQDELAGYNSQIGTAQANLSEVDKQIKAQEDEIKAIEAEIKRKEEAARKAAEEAAAAAASKAAADAAAGKKTKAPAAVSYQTKNLGDIHFQWPCPSGHSISSGYGSRTSPTEGASSSHMGIDIPASTGSSVVAAADGEVAVSTYSPSAGNYAMISHGGGTFTLYMHCSSLSVSTGQTVKAGQTIGQVGSTGYSTGPHLHFAIRSGGQYLNPTGYVSP